MMWRCSRKILRYRAFKSLRFSTLCGRIVKSEGILQTAIKSPIYIARRGARGPISSHILGIDHLKESHLNKGLAFTLEERQALGIYGLIPAGTRTQEEQVRNCMLTLKKIDDRLNKYIFLTELCDRNEKVFYRLFAENIESIMPIVHTPTLALACQKYCLMFTKPHGMFITINDRGHVHDILKNWMMPTAKVVVVTDGEKVMGLGDLGICGILSPVGKVTLYTAFAGIKPGKCVPIVLDVGTNNQEHLEDPLYLGLRHKRVTGQLYDEFIEEFMEAVVQRFGQNTLVHFEDFETSNAFRLLLRYRNRYCVVDDDIQGSGSVTLAGLLACCKATGRRLADQRILFYGAGQAAVGAAELCIAELMRQGVRAKDAVANIWMMDSEGLLVETRSDLDDQKAPYAKNYAPSTDLLKVVKGIKPTVLIGVSTVGGAFTPEIIRTMASLNETPVIFALSNPTANAECTAKEAYVYSEGRAIFTSGSPFDDVTYGDKTYKPGLGNTAWVFPAIGLGAVMCGMHHVPEEVFLVAAEALAAEVGEERFEVGSVYPPLTDIKETQIKMAIKICQYAYDKGFASVYPKPKDMRAYIDSHLYSYNYRSSLTNKWTWPEDERQ